ncbi:MAG: WYL domain-containing protein [Ktedonobacteraceae bacterium]
MSDSMAKYEEQAEHSAKRQAMDGELEMKSSAKAVRTMLLAVLFQVSWPTRLTKQEIARRIPFYGKSQRLRAVERDIETLTGVPIEDLPEPGAELLLEWCAGQQQRKLLALTYARSERSFGLAQSIFALDINEDEARAFVALRDGFTPGTPYAAAVQNLLLRWEWLFSEASSRLVRQKQRRQARPVLLPLSPVVDYSQHDEIILQLDRALEEGAYVSFAYTPLTQNWDAEPVWHERTEPYELEYRDGHWYYTAFIFDLNTFLDYRVDRIQPGTLRKEHDRFYPGGRQRPGVKVRYWISPMLARHGSLSARLREQHATMLDNDQGAIVEGSARSLWWARRLLLGYGEQVKALDPPELVQMMRETVAAMSRLYEEEK